jgi:segregation and condensation protein B
MELLSKLKNILESLLFVARRPLSAEDLSPIVGQEVPVEEIAQALEGLTQEYAEKGINIVKVAGGYLMGTNPASADYVYNLLHSKVQTNLSPQALETLAIIAYKQPVTRAEMERIRGVNSDGPIDTLLQKKIIEEVGRSEAVGRPFLYGTTKEFLRHFGLEALSSLPPLLVGGEEQKAIFESALSGQV